MNKYELKLLYVLVIIGITLFIILFKIQGGSVSDRYFRTNCFFVEGIILVILFLIQRRYNKENELKQKEELKETLLTQIDIFLYCQI
ncbi:hypothetical protein [Aliarcobacter butzleri]|uniref:hypothetical protein n=1 Tax=Aliarcobacter butzleri TaxID=28197 RepID=UPI003AFA81C1